MVSDINVLQQMMRDAAKIASTEHYGKKQITLTEPQCSNSSVTISGLPNDVIIIKADSFKSPDTIFNGSRGECKRADFIIIANSDGKKSILFIEMKATSKPENDIVAQLSGALCLISYIREIGKQFWKQKDFLNNYSHRFVSISHTSISKKRTRAIPHEDRPKGKHDSPDKMLKIAYPGPLRFENLAG